MDAETDTLIGVTEIHIQCVAYLVEMKSEVNMFDYRGLCVGQMKVEILPCDENGNLISTYVDAPEELIGKRVDFLVCLTQVKGLPKRFSDVYAQYSVLGAETKSTPSGKSVNVDLDHSYQVTIQSCTQKELNILANKPIRVQLRGKQKPGKGKPLNGGTTTKEIIKMKKKVVKKSKKMMVSIDSMKTVADNMLVQTKLKLLSERIEKIKALCLSEESKGLDVVSIQALLSGVSH
jgi:hypothetical protein